MTQPSNRTARQLARINYFGDAPTLAAPENLGRLRQPTRSGVADRRETSGEPGAAIFSPARQQATSGHNSPHGITGASPALATPAPADDAASGGRGLLSTAAHIARHAAGVGHRAYAVAAERIAHGQQLRAARTIFGKPSSKTLPA